ncbi:MAG: two-component sensor histidine kinase [Sphingobacteriales bacterium]|nr:two-component sensor histidine kinase [Sphingobacteriales bacterium]MBI3719385.1 two-component sensor histidine kinase [Sphingobacteriales bacterium]
MPFGKKLYKFSVITIVYWFLLIYIIAALSWWYIALEKQNQAMTDYKIQELIKDDPLYESKITQLNNEHYRKHARNIGEGLIFLLITLVGAIFVYRSVRKQVKFSQQQQNFMMAVTHELKTPIAVIKLSLETLQKRKLEEEKQQRFIEQALQETNRLNTLTNNILLAAQIDSGNLSSEKEEVNLSVLTDGCVQDFKQRFPNRNIEASIEPGQFIYGDTLLMQIAINNLIENALKYSPEDSIVHVDLTDEGERTSVGISDEGVGISEEEKKRVFDKFYRVGNENTRKTKGTGLGLYITKKIIEDHGAEINITDNTPTGTIFGINFYK